jgi:hypothetical protein
MNAIIYDIEIKRSILGKREQPVDGIEYCAGWHDHANMGISCICAYDYADGRYRVFMEDNLHAFADLVAARELIVGFNSISFDNAVCAHNGIHVPEEKSYDILVELWRGAGLGPKFEYPTHAGFGLDATCAANFGTRKSGNGALAPVLYQRKQFGELVDYCMNDVVLTKQLLDLILDKGEVADPRGSGKLSVTRPAIATAES